MGVVAILVIRLPVTRTFDGADSLLARPSKMRTFSMSTARVVDACGNATDVAPRTRAALNRASRM